MPAVMCGTPAITKTFSIWKPGALDAKIFMDLKRAIMTKGSSEPAGGPAIDGEAIEEMGVERFERFVLERVIRQHRRIDHLVLRLREALGHYLQLPLIAKRIHRRRAAIDIVAR